MLSIIPRKTTGVRFLATVVIIGGGIAGISAARAIRRVDRSWSIALVDDEDRLPYKRTKISKNIAQGFARDDFALHPKDWYAECGIQLKLGTRVEKIDVAAKTITLEDGERPPWDRLILAPGADARVPDVRGYDEERCHTIRRASDVDRLVASLGGSRRILVVGLGVLGIEVCDQLVKAGYSVGAACAGNSIMPRDLNASTQKMMKELLVANGVELYMGFRVESICASGKEVEVSSGKETVVVDHVIFAVGSIPRNELANSGGLQTDQGILVNQFLQTSQNDVFAAGDAVQLADGRIPHLWHEAEMLGEIAGVNAVGERKQYSNVAFRLKCEVFGSYFFSVGLPESRNLNSYAVLEVTGTPYQCFYFADSKLVGVVMVDDPERAKMYESAVRQGMSEIEVNREFLS